MLNVVIAGLVAVAAASTEGGGLPDAPELRKLDFKPMRILETQRRSYDMIAGLLGEGDEAKGAFSPYFQWPAGYQKLRVCFFGGTAEVRQTIRELASEWEQPDNSIRFDWGKNGFRDCETATKKRMMHIRVGFAEPGYWSALGTDSIRPTRPEELQMQSMNLEGMENLTAAQIREEYNGYRATTIQHEFGHAIGLTHEHQSPKAPCEADFDWDKIYKEFGGPPNNWSKEVIDFNLRQEKDPDFKSTRFDPLSIMKYYYDASMFKNGKESACYVPNVNYVISELDRKTIAFMYPASQEEASAREEQNRKILETAAADGGKGALSELLDYLMPPPAADAGED